MFFDSDAIILNQRAASCFLTHDFEMGDLRNAPVFTIRRSVRAIIWCILLDNSVKMGRYLKGRTLLQN